MVRFLLAVGLSLAIAATATAAPSGTRSFDGSGNNVAHPTWGAAGQPYRRIAAPAYADGRSAMASGPNARYLSNRIFNDANQNLFSENGISQWGWAWGQFIDHDMGLRDESSGGAANIGFDPGDPLESFDNELGSIGFDRTPAAPGTGVTNPRQQVNTLSSFLDASQIYGTDGQRRQWLLAPDGASLLTSGGYLPRASAKPNAPVMDLFGAQQGRPGSAVVAGDVRANENMALTALHTLFVREHNRIVAALPRSLGAGQRYDIARRVVGAEVQYITYTQFLPTLGVRLGTYTGYHADVNPTLTNEFATVGFRAHSMVHGEFEPSFPEGTFSQARLDAFARQGIEVEHEDGRVVLVISLSLAFGNPDLLQAVGLGPFLASLGEVQYKNDEQIDN
ncbi:MAG TPA: peroxidase family protein, partial [Candidatus Limnocylindrales bacterium]